MFGRKQTAEIAKEIADGLLLIENVRALQEAQKEMANAIAAISDRLRDMEANMRALKAETKHESLKETQLMLNAVQGAFNDKLSDISIRLSHVERDLTVGEDATLPKSPLIAIRPEQNAPD